MFFIWKLSRDDPGLVQDMFKAICCLVGIPQCFVFLFFSFSFSEKTDISGFLEHAQFQEIALLLIFGQTNSYLAAGAGRPGRCPTNYRNANFPKQKIR